MGTRQERDQRDAERVREARAAGMTIFEMETALGMNRRRITLLVRDFAIPLNQEASGAKTAAKRSLGAYLRSR